MERAKTIVTIHQLQTTLKENNTPKGCTVRIPLGLPAPIPEEIKTKWEYIQSKCSTTLTKVLMVYHITTSSKLKDQAKKITDEIYQSIVVRYKDTVTGIERTVTDSTSSIRNDADMAILSRINKRKRRESRSEPPKKKPKKTCSPPSQGGTQPTTEDPIPSTSTSPTSVQTHAPKKTINTKKG